MIWLSISAFALALVAVVCGVLALITSLRQRAARERWQSTTENSLQKLCEKAEKTLADARATLRDAQALTPPKLAAKVDELNEAVLALSNTHTRFAGRVWQRIGNPRSETRDAASGGSVDDPEFAAELALQLAPPVSPGRS